MPKLSVIIPIYNSENYIKKTLDVVVSQTLQDIEIICINDGSTDSSLSIVNEFAANDNRIKIIDQQNYGTAIAKNMGLKQAMGEYIAFCDSDDYPERPDFYEILYNKAKSENADIVKGNYKDVPSGYIPEEVNEWIKKDKTCFVGTYCSAIFKKSLLVEYEIKFPEINDMEDPVFSFLCAIKSNKVIVVDNLYHIITKRPNSITYGIPNLKQIKNKLKGLELLINIANTNLINPISYAYIISTWTNIVWKDSMKNYNFNVRLFVFLSMLRISKKVKNKKECKSFNCLILTPYKTLIFLNINNILQNIISIKNHRDMKHKVVTILGIKIKIKRRLHA